MPNTKIVATLGPATDAPGILDQFLAEGVDVFRLNASHGTQADHAVRIAAVHEAARATGVHVGILLDLPGVQVSLPSLTEKDLADLHFGLTAGIDLVALSFVRVADDVQKLRDRLGGRPVPIVAKIEKPEGWENIETILNVADGVMVARG